MAKLYGGSKKTSLILKQNVKAKILPSASLAPPPLVEPLFAISKFNLLFAVESAAAFVNALLRVTAKFKVVIFGRNLFYQLIVEKFS